MNGASGSVEHELTLTARSILDLARRRVPSRKERVTLFASVTRRALDALDVHSRAPGYMTRTWPLPALSVAAEHMEAVFLTRTRNVLAVFLFPAVCQLALEDLSPDERDSAEAEAILVIGSHPSLVAPQIGGR